MPIVAPPGGWEVPDDVSFGSIKWWLKIEISFLANTVESNPEFHMQIFHLAHCKL
jgi:hypothetical protein